MPTNYASPYQCVVSGILLHWINSTLLEVLVIITIRSELNWNAYTRMHWKTSSPSIWMTTLKADFQFLYNIIYILLHDLVLASQAYTHKTCVPGICYESKISVK